MWTVDNRTPYAVGRVWGRDKEGVHEWLVAVKASYRIRSNGMLVLADEQPPPLLLPEYNGEDGGSSLKYEAELVSPKPTTDVLLNGTAYAPHGRPATEFLATLRVGDVRKTIKVFGNRVWKRGVLGDGTSTPEPVTQVPIVYERAYGGFDKSDPDPKRQRLEPRNPVGCGLVAKDGQPYPNFEYPSGRLDKAGPAGFGPVASYWSPRLELQGTYDERWRKGRFPLLPDDWSPHETGNNQLFTGPIGGG